MVHRWKIIKWIDRNCLCCGLSKKKSLKVKLKKLQTKLQPKEQKYFEMYFMEFKTIYRILLFCFSILSLAFSGYWYCGCLLYVLLKIEVLEHVLNALWKSG